MEHWLSFVLKFNICGACIFGFYRLFLKTLTFYQWNRIYFLVGIAISFFIPVLNFPFSTVRLNIDPNWIIVNLPSQLMSRYESARSILPGLLPITKVAGILFLIGLGMMLLRLIVQFARLRKIMKKAELSHLGQSRDAIYSLHDDTMPFSVANRIYVNPHLYSEEELRDILIHEQYHVRQFHCLDILTFELILLLGWFNPFLWKLKQNMIQNLEYETDRAVIRKNGGNPEAYQLNLLKVCTVVPDTNYVAIHFTVASLRNRIQMMNREQPSGLFWLTRYILVFPLFLALTLFYNNFGWSQADHFIHSKMKRPDIGLQPLAFSGNSNQTTLTGLKDLQHTHPIRKTGSRSISAEMKDGRSVSLINYAKSFQYRMERKVIFHEEMKTN